MRLDSKTINKNLKLAIVALFVLLSPTLFLAADAQTHEPGTMNGNSQSGGPPADTNGPGTNGIAPPAQNLPPTDTTNFDNAQAQVNIITQAAEQDEQQVIQNTNEELLQGTEFGAVNDTYAGMSKFWGDDIIGNLFQNIGQLIGRWVTEFIDGWIADTVHFLTAFLRTFVLNPNIAVNGIQNGVGAGANGGGGDDISPYVRDGADAMYGIAVDLLLLLFILCIWKYWAEAAWRGGAGLFGAVGRLIFTAGLLLAWPTIYAFEVQITNEMINAIWFNSADQVAQLDAAMTSAVKGGLVAGIGLLANAFAPVVGAAAGGIVLGTVGEVVAFAGLVIYLFIGVILITELVYLLVLKAIQTGLLTAQYMFAPIFLVFFATPDTESVTAGFVRSFVEVSLWTFVWVGLLKIMVIILYSDYNPWGKIVMAVGILQIMIQVPTFLARASISPMSDFISAGMLTGGLMKGFSALGAMGQKRAMQAVDYFTNQQFGSRGMPQSKKVSSHAGNAQDPNLVNSLATKKPGDGKKPEGDKHPITGQPIVPPGGKLRGENKDKTGADQEGQKLKTDKEKEDEKKKNKDQVGAPVAKKEVNPLDKDKDKDKTKPEAKPGEKDVSTPESSKDAPGTGAEGEKGKGAPAAGATAGGGETQPRPKLSGREIGRALARGATPMAAAAALGTVLAGSQAREAGSSGATGHTEAEREKAEREKATTEGQTAQTLNNARDAAETERTKADGSKKEGAAEQKDKDVKALDEASKQREELKARTAQLLAAAGLPGQAGRSAGSGSGTGTKDSKPGVEEPAAAKIDTTLKDGGTAQDKTGGKNSTPAATPTPKATPADAARKLAEDAARGKGPLASNSGGVQGQADKGQSLNLGESEHHHEGDEQQKDKTAVGPVDATQTVTGKRLETAGGPEQPKDAKAEGGQNSVSSGPPPAKKAGEEAAAAKDANVKTDVKDGVVKGAAAAATLAAAGKVPLGVKPMVAGGASGASGAQAKPGEVNSHAEGELVESLKDGAAAGAAASTLTANLRHTQEKGAEGRALDGSVTTDAKLQQGPPANPNAHTPVANPAGTPNLTGVHVPTGLSSGVGALGAPKVPAGLNAALKQQGQGATAKPLNAGENKQEAEVASTETLHGEGASAQAAHLRTTHTQSLASAQQGPASSAASTSTETKTTGATEKSPTALSTPQSTAAHTPVPPPAPAGSGAQRLAALGGLVAAAKLASSQTQKTPAAGGQEKLNQEQHATAETLHDNTGAAAALDSKLNVAQTSTSKDNPVTAAHGNTDLRTSGEASRPAGTAAVTPPPSATAGAHTPVPPPAGSGAQRMAALGGLVAAAKLASSQTQKTPAAGGQEKLNQEQHATAETLHDNTGAAAALDSKLNVAQTSTSKDNPVTAAHGNTDLRTSGEASRPAGAAAVTPPPSATAGAHTPVPPPAGSGAQRLAALGGLVAAAKLASSQTQKTPAAGGQEKLNQEQHATAETLHDNTGAAAALDSKLNVAQTSTSKDNPVTAAHGNTDLRTSGDASRPAGAAAVTPPPSATAAAHTPVPPTAAAAQRLAALGGLVAAAKLAPQTQKTGAAGGTAERLRAEGEGTADVTHEPTAAGPATLDSNFQIRQNQMTGAVGREGATTHGATTTNLQESKASPINAAASALGTPPVSPNPANLAAGRSDAGRIPPSLSAAGKLAGGDRTVKGAQQTAETRGTQHGEMDVNAEADTINALRSDGSEVQVRVRAASPEARMTASTQGQATTSQTHTPTLGGAVVAPSPGMNTAAPASVAPPSKVPPTLAAAALHNGPTRSMASQAFNQVSQLQGRLPDPSMASQDAVQNLESVLLASGVPAATAAAAARAGILGVTATPTAQSAAQPSQTPNQTASIPMQSHSAAPTAQSLHAAPPRLGVAATPGPGGTPGNARVMGFQSIPGGTGGGGGGGNDGIDYQMSGDGGPSRPGGGKGGTPPPATGFANFDQDNYRWVPLRNLANDIRTFQGPQQGMSREDDGHGTTTMGAKGISNVKYGKDTSNSQKAMQLMAAGYAQVFTTDPAAYDAARQSAIDAGGDAPQGIGQRIAANLLAYSGKSFKQTAMAKQQFTQALYEQAMTGSEAYVNGDTGNAYTDYLRGRWGAMSSNDQAWGIHIMTDPTSPESGWSTTLQASSDTLSKAGMPFSAENRAAASNQAVLRQPNWARGLATRGVAAYSVAIAEQQLGPNAHSMERDALVGRIAPNLSNDYVDACRAIMEAAPSADIGARMCSDPVMVQSVAGTVAQARSQGLDIDASTAYKNLMGPARVMQNHMTGSQSVDVMSSGGGIASFNPSAGAAPTMPNMGAGIQNDTVIDQVFNNAGFVPSGGSVGSVGSMASYVPGVGVLGQTTMRPTGGFSSVHAQANRASMDVHGTVVSSSTPIAAPGSLTAAAMGATIQADTTVEATVSHIASAGLQTNAPNLGTQVVTSSAGSVPGKVTTTFIPGRVSGVAGSSQSRPIEVQARVESAGPTGNVSVPTNMGGEQMTPQNVDVVINPNLGSTPNISGVAPTGTVTQRVNPTFNFIPGQQRSGVSQHIVMDSNAVSSTPEVISGSGSAAHNDVATESNVTVDNRLNPSGNMAGPVLPSLNALPNAQQIRQQIRVDVVNGGLSNPNLGQQNYNLNETVQADSRHAAADYSINGSGSDNSNTYVQQGFAEVFVKQEATAGAQASYLQNEINSVGASAANRMGASMHVAKQIVIDMMSAGFENEHIQDPRVANVAMQIYQKDPSMLGTAAIAARVMNPEEYSVQTVETVQQMVDAGWSGRQISRPDVITSRMVIEQGIGDPQGRPGYGYPEPSIIREIRADRRFVPEVNYSSEQRGMTNRIPEDFSDPLLRQQMRQSRNMSKRFGRWDSGGLDDDDS